MIAVKTEINKYPSLESEKNEIVGLSVKWLQSGEVAQQDLGNIYSAINNSTDPFAESTKLLINDLGQSLSANQETLEFAKNLSVAYKQLAVSIKNNAIAAESETWANGFFNKILQNRPAMESLKQWNDLWSSTQAFVQREKAKVGSESSMGPKWNRERVIEVAVQEAWSPQEFSALELIAQLAKEKSSCSRYRDASSLAYCVGLGLFSKTQKKFFDPTYAGRYSELSADFATHLSRLSESDLPTLRSTLEGQFFGISEPIWSKCDNSAFTQRAAALKSQVNAIVTEREQIRKWELERQIRKTAENCQ
ncbi:MAG: hypothetical protein IPK04_20175 [Bdellovibrionales bacterium]|nr:hypothetical protein [Bdellovibrionales bacterium]